MEVIRVQKVDKKHCKKRTGNRRRKKNLHILHNLGKVMFVFILHGCQNRVLLQFCCAQFASVEKLTRVKNYIVLNDDIPPPPTTLAHLHYCSE
jgi:hypothetical protein